MKTWHTSVVFALLGWLTAGGALGATVAEVRDRIVGDYALENSSLHAVPVSLRGYSDAVYLELIVAGDEMNVRQMMLTLHQRDDRVMARVHAFPETVGDVMAPDLSALAIGMWAVPELFPELLPSQFDPVADVPVEVTDEGVRIFVEGAPAVQMNAALLDIELRFDSEQALWSRIGLTLDRERVWAEEVIFNRTAVDPPVTRHDNGMVTIDIRTGAGVVLEDGDQVSFHYIGVLDDGRVFDSTQFPGRTAYSGDYPGTLFPPLAAGLVGVACPTNVDRSNLMDQPIRKVILPPSIAFGENGSGPVPGNATLYFLTLVQSVRDRTPGE